MPEPLDWTPSAPLRTCLGYATAAEDAARFYVSLLPDSRIEAVLGPAGRAAVVEFTLRGAPFMALNFGSRHAEPSDAASISVLVPDQAALDRLWQALTADGGRPLRCGWLADRWGVRWQIVPEVLPRLVNAPDRAAAARAFEAMLGMEKLDIAALEAAFQGED